MAQHYDPNEDPNAGVPSDQGSVPVEPDEMEVEAPPRRMASAEFEVDASVESDVALREAMDPANQSLTDALRLSYRVLQLVMIVLLLLFFTSGIQTVETNQSGVFTRFGKIMDVNGQQSLAPGIQPTIWPYPIGEFTLFDVESREVDLGDVFFPQMAPGQTIEQAVERSNTSAMLIPGRDGIVLTRDGDIAHLRLKADYEVMDPVSFVRNIPEMYNDMIPDRTGMTHDENAADKLVKVALERAVVHVGATLNLQELTEPDPAVREEIRRQAQELLTDLDSGIRLKSIQIPDATPAFAIRKVYGELQDKRLASEELIEYAEQDAEEILLGAAGEHFAEVIALIDDYEAALDAKDDELSGSVLQSIHDLLGSDRISGEASRIVARARDYSAEIERTLGAEAQRFSSLIGPYREQPELVVRRRWVDTYSDIFAMNDVEVFHLPPGLGRIDFSIMALSEVAEMRRKALLDFQEMAARTEGIEEFLDFKDLRAGQIVMPGKAGRQFELDEEGNMKNTYQRRD